MVGTSRRQATPGDIYVADSTTPSPGAGDGAVYKVNPVNGESTRLHVGPPFVRIRGIAFGPEGNLFVTDIGAHAIHRIDLKTGAITTINTPLRAPWGIVYEPLLGDFLVTDPLLGAVVSVDPETGDVKTLVKEEGGLKEPHGIALAPGGPAYVTDFGARAVIKVARAAGGWKASSFAKGPFAAPEGIVAMGGSRFYVAETVAPGGLEGDPSMTGGNGGLFGWLDGETPELLYQPTTSGGALWTPIGLAPRADDERIYIGSTGGLPGDGSIVVMDVANRGLDEIARGFATPIGIAVAPPEQLENGR